VLAHEIGHGLGVGHSTDRDALMYPGILPQHATRVALSDDDIKALCTIYPADVELRPPPPPGTALKPVRKALGPPPERDTPAFVIWLLGVLVVSGLGVAVLTRVRAP